MLSKILDTLAHVQNPDILFDSSVVGRGRIVCTMRRGQLLHVLLPAVLCAGARKLGALCARGQGGKVAVGSWQTRQRHQSAPHR